MHINCSLIGSVEYLYKAMSDIYFVLFSQFAAASISKSQLPSTFIFSFFLSPRRIEYRNCCKMLARLYETCWLSGEPVARICYYLEIILNICDVSGPNSRGSGAWGAPVRELWILGVARNCRTRNLITTSTNNWGSI